MKSKLASKDESCKEAGSERKNIPGRGKRISKGPEGRGEELNI